MGGASQVLVLHRKPVPQSEWLPQAADSEGLALSCFPGLRGREQQGQKSPLGFHVLAFAESGPGARCLLVPSVVQHMQRLVMGSEEKPARTWGESHRLPVGRTGRSQECGGLGPPKLGAFVFHD